MVRSGTLVDCGPFDLEFYLMDGGVEASLDEDLLIDDRSGASNIFTILYSEVVEKRGVYQVHYKIFYTDY